MPLSSVFLLGRHPNQHPHHHHQYAHHHEMGRMPSTDAGSLCKSSHLAWIIDVFYTFIRALQLTALLLPPPSVFCACVCAFECHPKNETRPGFFALDAATTAAAPLSALNEFNFRHFSFRDARGMLSFQACTVPHRKWERRGGAKDTLSLPKTTLYTYVHTKVQSVGFNAQSRSYTYSRRASLQYQTPPPSSPFPFSTPESFSSVSLALFFSSQFFFISPEIDPSFSRFFFIIALLPSFFGGKKPSFALRSAVLPFFPLLFIPDFCELFSNFFLPPSWRVFKGWLTGDFFPFF